LPNLLSFEVWQVPLICTWCYPKNNNTRVRGTRVKSTGIKDWGSKDKLAYWCVWNQTTNPAVCLCCKVPHRYVDLTHLASRTRRSSQTCGSRAAGWSRPAGRLCSWLELYPEPCWRSHSPPEPGSSGTAGPAATAPVCCERGFTIRLISDTPEPQWAAPSRDHWWHYTRVFFNMLLTEANCQHTWLSKLIAGGHRSTQHACMSDWPLQPETLSGNISTGQPASGLHLLQHELQSSAKTEPVTSLTWTQQLADGLCPTAATTNVPSSSQTAPTPSGRTWNGGNGKRSTAGSGNNMMMKATSTLRQPNMLVRTCRGPCCPVFPIRRETRRFYWCHRQRLNTNTSHDAPGQSPLHSALTFISWILTFMRADHSIRFGRGVFHSVVIFQQKRLLVLKEVVNVLKNSKSPWTLTCATPLASGRGSELSPWLRPPGRRQPTSPRS